MFGYFWISIVFSMGLKHCGMNLPVFAGEPPMCLVGPFVNIQCVLV